MKVAHSIRGPQMYKKRVTFSSAEALGANTEEIHRGQKKISTRIRNRETYTRMAVLHG